MVCDLQVWKLSEGVAKQHLSLVVLLKYSIKQARCTRYAATNFSACLAEVPFLQPVTAIGEFEKGAEM
jgi:hypothetical protein